ncbi:ABC-F family ATP-binding cassette domain-containing protein [Gemella sp. GH3]|uniref:ABC-F family ATP-binding cassette domain-containing protein n=1 Tax=unclassified Gemella TaxID=2624949 RepID=UPI0015CF89D2|nr:MULTISPECIES: ABC-F family ATP-binding cassette domain-containing protein [unclassified Gemella]MBF0713760.1 ABC-F family ATP-binding cassette domain-containing protein [Gemella sp. GH3.1]NYS50712.1 ABC-F family ATP-binding cassette domain-containing protein [Gemella sp. GH3]
MLIQLNNISKYFVVTEVFSNVKLEINNNDKIAIVGRNGAGKSTLLKIIAGIDSYDSGVRTVSKNTTIGYLSQEFIVKEDKKVWDEMMSCFDDIIKLEEELTSMSLQLTEENINKDSTLLNRYDKLQNQVLMHKDYHYKSKIKSVLFGLNFSEADFYKSVSNFSGGEKTRLSMAKLLLSEPDVLILDEPTNHLDMKNVSWLESYLNSYSGAVVIVSHDRYFIDKIANTIYNVEFGRVKKYVGNYSKFIKQYEEDYEKQLKDYISQQKDIKKLEEFVQKNIARSSTSGRAKSRQKILDKIERIDNPKKDNKTANIEFNIKEQSGRDVLRVNNLSVGYNNSNVGTTYNFDVYKRDRIAIIGENGIGKSTLIKTIAKKQPALSGDIYYGSKVSLGYYDQKQAEFESVKTILNELWDNYPTMKESEIRMILGRFLFTGEDVLKIVRDLSGGEKARLQLAKLMLEENNLLVLDEPTNHLDIASKQVLEEALEHYEGTLVFVSHDRYFINKIANKVLEIKDNDFNIYLGNYDYYFEKKEQEKILASLEKEDKSNNKSKVNNYIISKEDRKLIRKLERERDSIVELIDNLETNVKQINEELIKEEVYTDFEKTKYYNEELQSINEELTNLNNKWLEIEEKLEEVAE